VNPLKRIQYAPEAFGSEDPMGFAPQLTVGVGLALRKGRGA